MKETKNAFENFGLSPDLLKAIKGMHISEPTEIQMLSIPSIMKGLDVIGESATGSGKTLAFGCAIIDKTIAKKGLQALVLAPTRELAEQVNQVLNELSRGKRLKIISVYGGTSINNQIRELQNADVVVGTPGRLLDHLRHGTIDISRIKILVLDEADRMLDMGFIKDVELIMKNCPQKKQTMFFSATITQDIRNLAHKYLIEPIKVFAENQVDPSKLKQVYFDVSRNTKLSLLIHLLKCEASNLVMVFCNTRSTVDFVVKNLKLNGVKAIAIHGGLSQNQRTRTINLFNDARIQILVCTDVAARGLHINNVSHIYNYETPKESKDYVHRIGRTARAGEEGIVINLLSEHDFINFSRIKREYPDFEIQRIENPEFAILSAVSHDEDGASNFSRFSRHGFKRNFGSRNSQGYGFRNQRSFGNEPKHSFSQENKSHYTERSNFKPHFRSEGNFSRNRDFDSNSSFDRPKRSFGQRSGSNRGFGSRSGSRPFRKNSGSGKSFSNRERW